MKLCVMANTTSGTQPTSTTSSARRAIIGSPGLIKPSDLCNLWGGPPYKSSPLCRTVAPMSLRIYSVFGWMRIYVVLLYPFHARRLPHAVHDLLLRPIQPHEHIE